MMFNIKKNCLVVWVSAIVLTNVSTAFAWDPLGDARDAAGRLGRAVEAETGNAKDAVGRAAAGMSFNVGLRNATRSVISYSINGEMMPPLAPRYGTTVSGVSVGPPIIRFDNGGGQTVVHKLFNGRYSFQWPGQVLQLVQD